MSRTLCVVVAASLAFAFGGTAGGSPFAERSVRADRREPNLALMRFTEQLAGLGVPPSFADRFLAEQRMTGTLSYALPAGDLDGDGSEDIFGTTIEYEVTFDDTLFLLTGIEISGRSEVSALSGRRGKVLWHREYDDFTIPVPARLGRNHRVGALLVEGLDTLVGPVNDRHLQIEALVGSRPNRLWSVSYRSQIVQQGLTFVAHNVPLSLGLFDALPGRADDLLVGVGEVASAGLSYVVSSQAHVIDGRSGDERVHPTIDVAVNWYPDPVPVGDLNDDRRDDYIVTVNPALSEGGQGGPTVDGFVYARTGKAGDQLWARAFEMEDIGWVYPLPDVVAGEREDLAIVTQRDDEFFTYLADGASGIERWRRPGGWPFSPGDIDRDDVPDVVTRDVDARFGRGEIHFDQRAYNGRGRKLWARTIVSSYGKTLCSSICFTSVGSGWWETGDADGDGLVETFLHHEVGQSPGSGGVFSYILGGVTGRPLLERGDDLAPLHPMYPTNSRATGSLDGRGSDVAYVQQTGGHVEVRAVDLSRGRPRTLWRSEVLLPAKVTKDPYVMGSSAQLDTDRCDDVLITLDGGEHSLVIAFGGGSGALRWWRTLHGNSVAVKALGHTDRNPRC